jgi:hypothetical protein
MVWNVWAAIRKQTEKKEGMARRIKRFTGSLQSQDDRRPAGGSQRAVHSETAMCCRLGKELTTVDYVLFITCASALPNEKKRVAAHNTRVKKWKWRERG